MVALRDVEVALPLEVGEPVKVWPGPLTLVASGGASGSEPLAVGSVVTAAAMLAKAVATTTPEMASSTPALRPAGGSAGGAVLVGVTGSASS